MIDYIEKIRHTNSGNFFLIAGPCVVENEKICFTVAEKALEITNKLGIPYIFKASFKKANRSRLDSFTGVGDRKGLEIIAKIGKELQIPVLTDIHTEADAALAAEYVDVLQIPAFLCRQTELLVAAAKTGKTVNIKKGQFLSPSAMRFAIDKVRKGRGSINNVHKINNDKIMLTERGTTFGYNDLVVDFRGIPEMKKFNVPVIVDVTHSLQRPNQPEGITGGNPEMISAIASAAIAVGADGIFLETHPNPAAALSDGANMLPLSELEDLLKRLVKIRKAIG
jgi:2-dehydro-3-deoxyphosphooctonate aldolase (KDO 8-P synthase)